MNIIQSRGYLRKNVDSIKINQYFEFLLRQHTVIVGSIHNFYQKCTLPFSIYFNRTFTAKRRICYYKILYSKFI